MPFFNSEETVNKAVEALKAYYTAKAAVEKANGVLTDRLGTLKTITGISGNQAIAIEEEVLKMLGQFTLHGPQ